MTTPTRNQRTAARLCRLAEKALAAATGCACTAKTSNDICVTCCMHGPRNAAAFLAAALDPAAGLPAGPFTLCEHESSDALPGMQTAAGALLLAQRRLKADTCCDEFDACDRCRWLHGMLYMLETTISDIDGLGYWDDAPELPRRIREAITANRAAKAC